VPPAVFHGSRKAVQLRFEISAKRLPVRTVGATLPVRDQIVRIKDEAVLIEKNRKVDIFPSEFFDGIPDRAPGQDGRPRPKLDEKEPLPAAG